LQTIWSHHPSSCAAAVKDGSRRRDRIANRQALGRAAFSRLVGESSLGDAWVQLSHLSVHSAGWWSCFIAANWRWSVAIFASAMALLRGASGRSSHKVASSRSFNSRRQPATSSSVFRDIVSLAQLDSASPGATWPAAGVFFGTGLPAHATAHHVTIGCRDPTQHRAFQAHAWSRHSDASRGKVLPERCLWPIGHAGL